MDEYSGKRAVDGLVVSRKGSGLVLRESPNNRDSSTQFCNRLGCNGRLNSTKATQIGKSKPLRPPVRASCSGKEIIGSSSRTSASVSNPRKSISASCKKLSAHLETDSSESSSVQDEPEVSDPIPPPGKIQRGLNVEKTAESSEVSLMEVGSSSAAANAQSRRNFNQRSGWSNQATLVGPSASTGSKNISMKTQAGATRYGLRNLRCNSISDVVPSNCSSSDVSFTKRSETIKKRNSEGESSSTARGKKINGSLSGQNSSSNGVSISDSRRGRNVPPNRDDTVASVRTRRSVNSQTRTRLSIQGNGNNISRNESPVVIPQRSHPEIFIDMSPGSSELLSTEAPLIRTNSCGRSGSSSENIRSSLQSGPAEVGFSRSLVNRDNLRRYNMDGIAEEEYVGGDEVGRLQCEHSYHAVCIQQWLRLKNWCPICKASAAPSHSRSRSRSPSPNPPSA
ncbi:43kDa postsynaptic protein [Parasponia andersonii]|uniref:RING-type E3 ubiquitin transferase n=1 Tax=Parasponia andersonii TaxID=3476 RepID=A0A2P5DIE2_PARAD|nr:43kDa postsynaptic protein [Parasponia andersonii]